MKGIPAKLINDFGGLNSCSLISDFGIAKTPRGPVGMRNAQAMGNNVSIFSTLYSVLSKSSNKMSVLGSFNDEYEIFNITLSFHTGAADRIFCRLHDLVMNEFAAEVFSSITIPVILSTIVTRISTCDMKRYFIDIASALMIRTADVLFEESFEESFKGLVGDGKSVIINVSFCFGSSLIVSDLVSRSNVD